MLLYGITNNYRDITTTAKSECVLQNILHLPRTDQARTNIFGDHAPGHLKSICFGTHVIEANQEAYIDLLTKAVYTNQVPAYITSIYNPSFSLSLSLTPPI